MEITMRIIGLLKERRGSVMVLALLVSLLLMVLITATMTLSVYEVEAVQDYARNKKTLQAADSGLAHGSVTLAHALSSFSIPANTRPADIQAYANEAEAGITEGDADISLLVDTGQFVDEVLPRQLTSVAGYTEYGSGVGLNVDYDVAMNITPTSVDRPPAHDTSQKHTFHYQYDMDSEGGADIGGQSNAATRRQSGTFDVEVERPNFSTYGYFTQSMKNQFGSQLWFYDGEVYGGPTHVNSAPPSGQCAFWGTPTFNGAFSAVQGSYDQSLLGGNANPQFNDSVSWGVDPITLPANGWSQLRASIGDLAHVEDATMPSNSELRGLLGLPSGSTAVDPGVYYSSNYNSGSSLLGGIFVNGTAQTIGLDVVDGAQQITITMNNSSGQFNGAHTWVFKDNTSTQQCTVSMDGGTPVTFSGNLNGVVHTQGNVNSLAGDSALSTPDVQSNHELTISTSGNTYINNHLTYETDPVANPNAVNILGIYSSGGNIYLGQSAPSGLTVDATVMASGTGKGVGAEGITSGGSYVYSYPNKGNWNLLGGLIENVNQTTGVFYTNGHITGYTWNFTYDERFLDGHAPPFFPYVTRFVVTMLGVRPENWGRKYY